MRIWQTKVRWNNMHGLELSVDIDCSHYLIDECAIEVRERLLRIGSVHNFVTVKFIGGLYTGLPLVAAATLSINTEILAFHCPGGKYSGYVVVSSKNKAFEVGHIIHKRDIVNESEQEEFQAPR